MRSRCTELQPLGAVACIPYHIFEAGKGMILGGGIQCIAEQIHRSAYSRVVERKGSGT